MAVIVASFRLFQNSFPLSVMQTKNVISVTKQLHIMSVTKILRLALKWEKIENQ